MKRKLSIFIITFLILQNLSYADNGIQLKDINNSVFKNSILKAQQKGIINGYADGTFKPNNGVSFIESLAILIKSGNFAQEVNNYKSSSDSHWSTSYKKMYNDKFLAKELKFSDSQNITRDFAVYLMLRQIGVEFESGDFSKINNKFPDITSYSTFAPYLAFAGQVGISNGYGDGTFGPKKSVSRGELTAMSLKTLIDNKDYILSEYQKIKGNSVNTSTLNNTQDNTKTVIDEIKQEQVKEEIKEQVKEEIKQPVITGEYTDESWDAVTKLNTFDEVKKYLNYYPSNNDKKLIAYTKLAADRNYEGGSEKIKTLNAYWREGINPGVPKFMYPGEYSKTVYDVTDKVIPQVQKDIVSGIKYTGSGFYPNEMKLEELQNLYKTDKTSVNNYLKEKFKWYLENGSATSKFIEKTWIKDTTYLKFYFQSEILGQSLQDHNMTTLGYSSYIDIGSHSFYNEDKDIYLQAYQEEIQRRFGLTPNEFSKKVLEEYLQKGQELGLLNSNWKVTQLPKNLQHLGMRDRYYIAHPYTSSDKVKPIGEEVNGAVIGVGGLVLNGDFIGGLESEDVNNSRFNSLILFSDYLK